MTKKNKLLLGTAVILCIFSMVFSGLIQRGFGKIEMTDITIRTEVGTFTGYLLKPDSASRDNPAPAVVTSHGYLNNREMQDLNWIELSRRGYVVFAMNAYSHGDSSVPGPEFAESVEVRSGGMVDAVEYISSLPFVDKSKIGVTGHSMGGGYANTTMDHYTNLERNALTEGVTEEKAKWSNKVAAGLIIGNYPDNLITVEDRSGNSGYLCDLGIIAGKYDEFFGAFTRDMMSSDTGRGVVAVQTGLNLQGDIEEGEFYKNSTNGYRIAKYQPRQFHAWNHFSIKTVGHLIQFFEETLGAPNPKSTSKQIWWLKEIVNFVGLIGFFLFIIPFTDLLLNISWFSSLRCGEIKPLPKLEEKQKRRYLTTNISSGVLSFIVIIPALLGGYMIMQSKFWPQDTTGGIGLWAVFAGLISLWMLRLGFGKKLKGNGEDLGVKIGRNAFLKTIILAIVVLSGTYALVFLADYLFQTDFRIWSFCIRIFSAPKLWVAIKYLPLFAVYYIFNSIAVSRSNFENWSESKQVLITAAFNMMAPAILLIITYVPVIWLGQTPWSNLPGILSGAMALIPILMIPFVPILGIAAYIGVRSYKLTGRIWLGALINTMLITMITVANTSFTYPY